MKSFSRKGGIFWSIFKNAHYSYRQLVYDKVIQGKTDPAMRVSGSRLLNIVSRVLAAKEAEEDAALEAMRRLRAEQEARWAAVAQTINTALSENNVADTTAAVSDEGVKINLSNIQFLPDSATLVDSEKAKIREIASILKDVSGDLLVAGHTALSGTEAEQIRMSRARAQTVADFLIAEGARKRSDITVEGFGASRPLGDNNTPEGQALNRRVEITIIGD